MISYLKGELIEKKDGRVIIETGGIGYEIFVSNNTLVELGDINQLCCVYTYLQVREDGLSLFGFATLEEREIFNLLISVSGIGPKGAIAILSGMKISDLIVCISSENVKALSSIKGLGKKTAERLVVELKDKVSPFGFVKEVSEEEDVDVSAIDEAVLVLTSLGLTKNESLHLAKLNASGLKSAEDIVSAVLKNMGA